MRNTERIPKNGMLTHLSGFEKGVSFEQVDDKTLIIRNNEDVVEIKIMRGKMKAETKKKYVDTKNVSSESLSMLYSDGKKSMDLNIKLSKNRESFDTLTEFVKLVESLNPERVTIEEQDSIIINAEIERLSNIIGGADFVICGAQTKHAIDFLGNEIEIVEFDSVPFMIVGKRNSAEDEGIVLFQNHYKVSLEAIGFNPQKGYKIIDLK